MTTVAFEFENLEDLEEAWSHLWERLGVSGEMIGRPLSDGRWRLDVVSEKPLRAPTLEKLKGRRLED